MKKFKDNGELMSQFYTYRIVGCPKCKCPVDFYNLRIVCIECGYSKSFESHEFWYQIEPKISVDIEDYLQISCCGNSLWAMNTEHLEFLEKYVEADLRERTPNINKSLASRLPQWIKNSKNRDEILKCIKKLRKKLSNNNYKTVKKAHNIT